MKKLSEYLKDMGIRQRRFAEKIGVNEMSLSHYLSGKSIPTIQTAYLIEKHSQGKVTLYDWVIKDNDRL